MSSDTANHVPESPQTHPEDEHGNGTHQMAAGAAQFASGAKQFIDARVVPAAKAAAHTVREKIDESTNSEALHSENKIHASRIQRYAPKALVAMPVLMFISLWLPVHKSHTFMSVKGSDGPYLLVIALIALVIGAAALYLKLAKKPVRIVAGVVALIAGLSGMVSGFGTMSLLGASFGGLVLAFSALALAIAGVAVMKSKRLKK